MSILVHSSAIPVRSCSIPVHSCSFLRILVPFLQTPADSSGMGSFLQESVGHGEVLVYYDVSNNVASSLWRTYSTCLELRSKMPSCCSPSYILACMCGLCISMVMTGLFSHLWLSSDRYSWTKEWPCSPYANIEILHNIRRPSGGIAKTGLLSSIVDMMQLDEGG